MACLNYFIDVKQIFLTYAGVKLHVQSENCLFTDSESEFLSELQFDTLWSRTGSCSRQICQGNIRGAVFWPWPTKHFLASFNFIMKAWTATNSQIGTKPIWGPHPPLHSLHDQYQSATGPFSHVSVCMKTNVYHPLPSPSLHSLGEVGGAAYRRSLCLCVCPQTLPHASPFCHTHPSQIPPSTPSGALYHDAVSFIRGGPVFKLMWDVHSNLRPCDSVTMRIWRCTVHLLAGQE